MDKRYAIFDMDGTLVDSMGFWQSLEREFLVRRGVTDGLDELLERTKPLTLSEAAEMLAQSCHFEGTPEQLMEEVLAIMEEHYRADIAIKPGAREYLAQLHAAGVTMCVASATPRHLVEICMDRLDLSRYFTFMLSCVDVGAGKRQPDVYLEAARRLGATPAETAVFEDAIYAVRTAHDAGFHVVAVKDGPQNAACWDEMAKLAHETVEHWDLFR